MKSLLFMFLAVVISLSFFSCDDDDSPSGPSSNAVIKGVILDASTGNAVANATVTTDPASKTVSTDAQGNYQITGVTEGKYVIKAESPKHRLKSSGEVDVAEGNTPDVNLSLDVIPWISVASDNSGNVAIPDSLTILLDGTPIANGDEIGVFYDSSGVLACGGFVAWDGTNIALTVYGDVAQTNSVKEGFAAAEEMNWKIMRQNDGKVFNVSVTYDTSVGGYVTTNTYAPNGLYLLSGITQN
jgi:hypothetical protein